MAELTVESGPLRGQTLMFSESDPFVIGRAADCSLRLEVPGVADRHIVIKALKDGGFGVKKLDGEFLLNGKGAQAARLADGDVLEVGGTQLRFGPPEQNGKLDVELKLEGYRLIEVLGKGGHGTVYRAEQLSLHREIALKVLHKDLTRNPEFVGRFVAEARAAARLSHPNVVQVFDVGHDADTYYLSMEIMEHGSLEDRLRKGRIPVEDCLQFIIDASKGLAYAESMRIVHRDIKPDNLMVDSHDTAKIADLGLAMSDDEEQGKILGTPHFMSPEQVLNRPLDHRSDLYSLGCTFFRLVTGRVPFPRKTTKEILTAHVKTEPEAADEVNADVPTAVADIIDRLLEKDPEDRYQSANELIEDLETVLHPPAKKGLWIAIVAVLMLCAGFAIYWGVTRPERKGGTKIITVRDKQLEKELRETKALARFNILINQGIPPLQKAGNLEAFSKHANFTGTKAAGDALARAAKLRVDEKKRIASERLRSAKIAAARDKLRGRLQKLIEAGEFKAAATGLKPTDIAADILRDAALRAVVAEMKSKLRETAAARLGKLQAAVAKAMTDRDPNAVATALDQIDIILDRTNPLGWPAEAFANRSEVTSYARTSRKDVTRLRADLAESRESLAWANYRQRTLGKGGILAQARAFDLAAAATLAAKTHTELAALKPAAKTHTELGGPKPAALSQSILDLVTAALAYEKSFQAAIAAGKVTIPVDIDGAMTGVIVKSLVTSGSGAGVTVAVPKNGATETRQVPLSELSGGRLFEVFVELGTGADAVAANRIAFLALHVLLDHIDAASRYMGALDPKDPASGTGANRFSAGTADLNVLILGLAKVAPPWGMFLADELHAARETTRALRSFSRQQYTSAHGYLEGIQKHHRRSLAALKLR